MSCMRIAPSPCLIAIEWRVTGGVRALACALAELLDRPPGEVMSFCISSGMP